MGMRASVQSNGGQKGLAAQSQRGCRAKGEEGKNKRKDESEQCVKTAAGKTDFSPCFAALRGWDPGGEHGFEFVTINHLVGPRVTAPADEIYGVEENRGERHEPSLPGGERDGREESDRQRGENMGSQAAFEQAHTANPAISRSIYPLDAIFLFAGEREAFVFPSLNAHLGQVGRSSAFYAGGSDSSRRRGRRVGR